MLSLHQYWTLCMWFGASLPTAWKLFIALLSFYWLTPKLLLKLYSLGQISHSSSWIRACYSPARLANLNMHILNRRKLGGCLNNQWAGNYLLPSHDTSLSFWNWVICCFFCSAWLSYVPSCWQLSKGSVLSRRSWAFYSYCQFCSETMSFGENWPTSLFFPNEFPILFFVLLLVTWYSLFFWCGLSFVTKLG